MVTRRSSSRRSNGENGEEGEELLVAKMTTTKDKEKKEMGGGEDIRESPLIGLIGMIIRNLTSDKLRQPGIFGFSSNATAEEATDGIYAPHLTAIVTGASSGIGLETTRVLAMRGVEVVMAVRNVNAGEAAKAAIAAQVKQARLRVMKLDVSSLQSVRGFCDSFASQNAGAAASLNILINNAGMMGGPFKLSPDGVELNFATNYLGHYLLTKLLLPTMIATAKDSGIQGRIVNVSSESHYYGFLTLDSLNKRSKYWSYLAYARSKLATILHANELAKRLEEQGANVTINSLHPGIIVTNLVNNSFLLRVVATYMQSIALKLFLKTIPQGAATQCFLALHPAVSGANGKYFQNCAFSKRSKASRSPKLGRELWDFTEDLLSKIG